MQMPDDSDKIAIVALFTVLIEEKNSNKENREFYIKFMEGLFAHVAESREEMELLRTIATQTQTQFSMTGPSPKPLDYIPKSPYLELFKSLSFYFYSMGPPYDARARGLLFLAYRSIMQNSMQDLLELESSLKIDTLSFESKDIIEKKKTMSKNKRMLITAAATAGGGLVIGLSAGLLAPVIGIGMGTVLGTVGVGGTAAHVLGSAGLITATGVLTGSGVAGFKTAKRTRHLTEFKFLPMDRSYSPFATITIAGWINDDFDFSHPFCTMTPHMYGDRNTLVWESKVLESLGSALEMIAAEALTTAAQGLLAHTILGALLSALTWPLWLLKLGYLIDNPWAIGLDRAYEAGIILAETLALQKHRVPVVLIGFSLGARVIAYALLHLNELEIFDLVQDAFIFGAPVVFSDEEWGKCRSVVGGRLVNGYSQKDWVLGFLFRAGTFSATAIAGLAEIKGAENVDFSEIVNGHLDYKNSMPKLLRKVGLTVHSEELPEDYLDLFVPRDISQYQRLEENDELDTSCI